MREWITSHYAEDIRALWQQESAAEGYALEIIVPQGGEEKKPVVEEILAGKGDYPSAHVGPTDGRLTWLLGWP